MTTIDPEVVDLALLALKNAFYKDFSKLVHSYAEAANGLNVDRLMRQLQDGLSVYSIASVDYNILSIKASSAHLFGHSRLIHALEDKLFKEIYLEGKKVFERRNDEWYYVGD